MLFVLLPILDRRNDFEVLKDVDERMLPEVVEVESVVFGLPGCGLLTAKLNRTLLVLD